MKYNVLIAGEFWRGGYHTGGQGVNEALLKHLASDGRFNVRAVSPVFSDEAPQKSSLPLTFLHTNRLRAKSVGGDLVARPSFLKAVRRFLRETGFDPHLIHADDNPAIFTILRGTPKTTSLYGSNELTLSSASLLHPYSYLCLMIAARYERRMFDEPDLKKIFASSESAKNRLAASYHPSPEGLRKIEVVTLGANTERFGVASVPPETCRAWLSKKLGVPGKPDPIFLLFVGGLAHHKGQLDLVENFPLIAKRFPGAHLLIVGRDCGILGACEAAAEKGGFKERIFFLTDIKDDELGKIYKGADIYVMASLEGWALNQAEAMTLGLPVVAWDRGANRELFTDGVEGYLVQNGEEFAKKVSMLVEDTSMRRRMAKASAEHARANFGWEHYGRKMADHFAEVLAGQ